MRGLVAAQFPQWAPLPVRPVARQGHDNRTFRLGEDLVVRLPSHEDYVAGLAKEDAFLPVLADHLSAGRHCFYRGCHPSVYGDQVQTALTDLAGQVDVDVCQAIWRNALRSAWSAAPVWFHGDLAVGNLLTTQGRLAAVIDFGTCGVGDPACDLVMAWTFFDGEERQIFRQAAGLSDDDWERARGWALWKALITVGDPDDSQFDTQARALAQLTQDPVTC